MDPIEFEAGDVNFYRYVGNDCVNFVDPSGLFTLTDAYNSLTRKGVAKNGVADPIYSRIPIYTDEQIFNEWLELERSNMEWINELPKCPKTINDCTKNPDVWNEIGSANPEHKGGVYESRSHETKGGHANQCVYDKNGKLIDYDKDGNPLIPAAGTADYAAMKYPIPVGHMNHDLRTWWMAKKLNRRADYYSVRPVR